MQDAGMTADDEESLRKMLNSNALFAQLLVALGVDPPVKISPTTGKEVYAFAKTDEELVALLEHEDPRVATAVAARFSAKTSIEETRTETLIDYASRGTFPIALRYYGANTGRWSAESSAATNMQNLPRTSPIKGAIRAPAGQVLCGADLSNIELRLGLWLASQDDRVQMLAQGTDLYKDFAAMVFSVPYADVTKPQRQVGKVANLSLIYGTGAAKLRDALRIIGGVTMTAGAVQPIVDLYRQRYAQVVAAWREGEKALSAMAAGERMPLFRGGVCTVEGTAGIRLPSGLHLQFPNLRRVTRESDSKPEWVFDSKYGEERVYGARVFQGVTQAIARCIMADGMLRVHKRYPVRLMIHDSAYWLAPEHEAEAALQFGIDALTSPVAYCPGLPLAAEGAFGKSLADC